MTTNRQRDNSNQTRGHRSKSYLDPSEENGECKTITPADPKKVQAYRDLLESRGYKKRAMLEPNREHMFPRFKKLSESGPSEDLTNHQFESS